MSENPVTGKESIIFFDGVCNLCNGFVDRIIRADRGAKFHFASLQGETAKEYLSEKDRTELASVILVTPEGKFTGAAAVIQILSQLSFAWRLGAWLMWLCPAPLREWLYKQVARSRYSLFGQRESCRLPSESERGRLLP